MTLEFMGPSSFVTSLSIDVTAMGSYDNTVIYSANVGESVFLFVNIDGGSTIESSALISSPISVMRSMRQSLQPLPSKGYYKILEYDKYFHIRSPFFEVL